jgi:hypothetical protein
MGIQPVSGGKYMQILLTTRAFSIYSEFNGVTSFYYKKPSIIDTRGDTSFKVVADAGDALLDSGVFLNLIEGLTNADLQVVKL